MTKPSPTVVEFYAMLGRVGLSPVDAHPLEAERINAAINELSDYPIEWFPYLEKSIVEKNVTNVGTVLRWMRTTMARGIAPDEKPKQNMSDAYINSYYEKIRARACDCDDEWCTKQREILNVTSARVYEL